MVYCLIEVTPELLEQPHFRALLINVNKNKLLQRLVVDEVIILIIKGTLYKRVGSRF